MNIIKRLSLYVWAYRQKERLKDLFRYKLPLRFHVWRAVMRERQLLLEARKKYEHLYCNMNDPLVSVTIATYNRGRLLTERTLPSVLAQTYQNFEIVVVGDCCTDDTEERIAQLNDPRIRFYNLPRRGPYPSQKRQLWQVAGSYPINAAREKSNGLWIAHLDDDEMWEPFHLATLLAHGYSTNAELVHSQAYIQRNLETWEIHGCKHFKRTDYPNFHNSSAISRSYLRLFHYSPDTWRYNIGTDTHLYMRMLRSGVHVEYLEKITVTAPLRFDTTRYSYQAEDYA